MSGLRVATYNVHDCIGRDGVYAPERVAEVVGSLEADLVALQEVTLDHAGDVVGLMQQRTGLQAVDGTLFERGIGRYGNLLLSRCQILGQGLHDLSYPDREPRGAIEAHIGSGRGEYRVLGTHLGLSRGERASQIARIEQLSSRLADPVILLGDLNVWWGRWSFSSLRRQGFALTGIRSFPSRPLPFFALDRIGVTPPAVITRCWRERNRLTAVASDHLPVVAEIETIAPP